MKVLAFGYTYRSIITDAVLDDARVVGRAVTHAITTMRFREGKRIYEAAYRGEIEQYRVNKMKATGLEELMAINQPLHWSLRKLPEEVTQIHRHSGDGGGIIILMTFGGEVMDVNEYGEGEGEGGGGEQ